MGACESANHVSGALPRHVAIIMDGNGRWAKQRGRIRVLGHHAGAKAVRKVVKNAAKLGIEQLTLFAFSSENWRRPAEEVSQLMKLFMTLLQREVKMLNKHNIKLRIIGNRGGFTQSLQQKIANAEALTANNSGLSLNIAANYGGRWDITQQIRYFADKISRQELTVEQVDEAMINNALSDHSVGDVDLMIRTGGEHRISNFLIWQLAYAELYFTNQLWPDFDEQDFSDALASYVQRERRFGCTSEQIQQIIQAE
ncbi:isoprenyl transferase [Celerinatantimonas yamalensis]|uniref:Ditrans,polycis-undecaprenyl-diphosphate synthase ((2E,6E)-farnesyl-diphosphate specific) n=1 Tax=Celerinatantimonas yamalensis TaxID=559956 RepID=A0ABW9G837_9GAMM